MPKKRTKSQKQQAQKTRVKTQLAYEFNKSYNLNAKNEMSVNTMINDNSGTIKKELFKSLTVALFILIGLAVLYWFS